MRKEAEIDSANRAIPLTELGIWSDILTALPLIARFQKLFTSSCVWQTQDTHVADLSLVFVSWLSDPHIGMEFHSRNCATLDSAPAISHSFA